MATFERLTWDGTTALASLGLELVGAMIHPLKGVCAVRLLGVGVGEGRVEGDFGMDVSSFGLNFPHGLAHL